MVLISVIVPTFNRSGFLVEAIDSVLAQDRDDVELIVVDDGSIDDTPARVAAYGSRVRYLRQENAGPSAARNAGLAAARGDLISFLDSDDRMLAGSLAKLKCTLDVRPDVALAYGWYFWMTSRGQPRIGGPILQPRTRSPWGIDLPPVGTTLEGDVTEKLLLEEAILLGTILVRRTAVESVGGFDPGAHMQEQWDFLLRLAASGVRFACVPEPLAAIRLHAGNRGADNDAMLESRMAIVDRILGSLPPGRLDPDRSRALRRRVRSEVHADSALFDLLHGRGQRAAKCLGVALAEAPVREFRLTTIADQLARRALEDGTREALETVDDFIASLPPGPSAERLRRRARAGVHKGLALAHLAARAPRRIVARQLAETVRVDRRLLGRRETLRYASVLACGDRALRVRRLWGSGAAPGPLAAVEGRPVIAVSPHLDDAVFSAGGTLALLARRGVPVVLATVFTAARPGPLTPLAEELRRKFGLGNDHHATPCQEDVEACTRLGIEPRWLGLPDVLDRTPDLRDTRELCARWRIAPEQDPIYDEIYSALATLLLERPQAIVLGPLAIGQHRDHVLVHAALREAWQLVRHSVDLYLYEDFPYVLRRSLPARLLAVSPQILSHTVDIAATLTERVEAMQVYRSQCEMVFEEGQDIGTLVSTYCRRIGTGRCPAERFWSIPA